MEDWLLCALLDFDFPDRCEAFGLGDGGSNRGAEISGFAKGGNSLVSSATMPFACSIIESTDTSDARVCEGDRFLVPFKVLSMKGNVDWINLDRDFVNADMCDFTEGPVLKEGFLMDLESSLNMSKSISGSLVFGGLTSVRAFMARALLPKSSDVDIGLIVSSKRAVNTLPFVAGFMGLSSINGSLSSSPSPSLLSLSYPRACSCNFGRGRIAGDNIRLRFSLLGEGDTRSPLRRFRARVIAEGNSCGIREEIETRDRPGDGCASKF